MSVIWGAQALADRRSYLDQAFDHALEKEDPQINSAAEKRDDHIETEGNKLDDAATYVQGPLPDSHVYTVKGGRFVILYTRDGKHVHIERVLRSRSNWRGDTSLHSAQP